MTDRERLEALIRENIGAFTDALIAAGVSPPPHLPPTPPPPTWEPSFDSKLMVMNWQGAWGGEDVAPFLRRLYAQLHRDRVAALPVPSWDDPTIAVIRTSKEQVSVARTMLLALADDGNGA